MFFKFFFLLEQLHSGFIVAENCVALGVLLESMFQFTD